MPIRLITTLMLVLGAFIAPWWAVALGTLICIVAYRRFVEGLVPMLVLDLLYGAQPIMGIPGFLTITTGILVIVSMVSDTYLRGHVRI